MSRSNIRLGLKSLKVKYHSRYVGTLAVTGSGLAAFSYDESWLKEGFSISPFSLPLSGGVFVPKKTCFDGLFGIFADSLPDAWGRLLLDRMLKKYGIEGDITALDRLAMVGRSGMGALEYEPDYQLTDAETVHDIDYLAGECRKILSTQYSEELDGLYRLGGSSGGARPKIMTAIDGKEWIIKFPVHVDSPDMGRQEYYYSVCAKKCGIDMTETRLFPSETCSGYFGTVRFDRSYDKGQTEKIHTASAAALLEADFRTPCLDYNALMKLAKIITGENKHDVENMFRRMCFNVYAHNLDDHAKNFSFLYDEHKDLWRLSPAYDLTNSSTYWGQHTTSVDGNGADPGEAELLNVGIKAGLSKNICLDIIRNIDGVVKTEKILHRT